METPSPVQEPTRAPARSALQVVLIILGVALGLFVMYQTARVILVLILAMFFAYFIMPLVVSAERLLRAIGTPRRLVRALAIGLVYLTLAAGCAAAATSLLPRLSQQVTEIASAAPEYVEAVKVWGDRWSTYERRRLPPDVRARVDEAIFSATEAAFLRVRESVVETFGMVTYAPWLILIPVLAFFLLKDVDHMRFKAVDALPARFRGRGYQFVQELNTALYAYVRAQLLACLLIGVVCTVGFALLGVPYAALLGVFAGVMEFIPLVGPAIVALVAGIIAAVSSSTLAFWVLAFLLVLRIVEDYVIYPRLMGRGTHLSPLTVIIAVLAGAEIGGVLGIFLAVPAAASLSVAYRHWTIWERAREEHL